MEWLGSNAILLNGYLDNKQKLVELKEKKRYLDYRGFDTSEIGQEINKIEQRIIEFVCSLDAEHLKSIIYMSLDIEVEIGYPDKPITNEI